MLWAKMTYKSKSVESDPNFFPLKGFYKLFQSGLWTYIWSKMSLIRSILSKLAIFGKNDQTLVISDYFGAKMTSYVKILGNLSNNFSPKSIIYI